MRTVLFRLCGKVNVRPNPLTPFPTREGGICRDFVCNVSTVLGKWLIKQYIKISEHPKHGTRAIAILFKEQQQELDLSDSEFTKLCDTFKISPAQLNSIYAGEAFDDKLLLPLTRVLGITKERLLEVRDGSEEENNI